MKNVRSAAFVLGFACVFSAGCYPLPFDSYEAMKNGLANLPTSIYSYQLPDSYDTMKNRRAKDSITYLYRCHVAYGATLFATDTINLFPRAGKQAPSLIATQGDTLTVLDFRDITKSKKEKEAWAYVKVCSGAKHFTAWLPARSLVGFTTPDRWTRHVLPAPLLQREPSFKSCAPYLIPFAVLLLFGFTYVIIAWRRKRKYKKNAPNSIAVYLWYVSLASGIIMLTSLFADASALAHFYYNPNILSWGELPFLVILLIISFAAVTIMAVAASVRAFCKFKWPMAIYHTFGYLSIPVATIPSAGIICILAFLAISVIAQFYILRFSIRLFTSRFFLQFLLIVIAAILSAIGSSTTNRKRY
jgi:hypothetical protein